MQASQAPAAAASRSFSTTTTGDARSAARSAAVGSARARTQQESAISAGKRGRTSHGPSSLPSTISVASDSETADSMAMLSQAEMPLASAESAVVDERVGPGSPLSPRARVAAWNDRESGGAAYPRDVAKGSLRRVEGRHASPSALSEAKSSGAMSGLNGGLDYAEPSPPGVHTETGRGGGVGSSSALASAAESVDLDSSQMASTRSDESRHLADGAASL